MKSVTIYDVAREAGTSKSTVARVLSNKGYAATETSTAVLNAAKRLGYEVDEQAQRLAKGRYDNDVDIYTYEMDFGAVLRKVKAVQWLLHHKGISVTCHFGGSDLNSTQVTIARLRRRKAHAIICNGWGISDDALAELSRYHLEGGTLVCFCYNHPLELDCDQVVFDEEDNTYQAIKYLIGKGHREIGFNSHLDPDPNHPRILGFRRAMREAGYEVRPEWIFCSGIYESGGVELAEKFLDLKTRPTAMCISNDVTAASFVHVIYRAGLRVPDDVSVVGHDDSPSAAACLVPLTVVTQPIMPDAEQVVQLLQERLDGYDGLRRVRFTRGELIERSSVACV